VDGSEAAQAQHSAIGAVKVALLVRERRNDRVEHGEQWAEVAVLCCCPACSIIHGAES
jgi:hypothetical protein